MSIEGLQLFTYVFFGLGVLIAIGIQIAIYKNRVGFRRFSRSFRAAAKSNVVYRYE